jgi:hypothetical protein
VIWTLAVDPGAHTGWAWGGDSLVSCGLAKRIEEIPDTTLDRLVIEIPHPGRGRASRQDINALSERVGAIVERVHAPQVVRVSPIAWKGAVPKEIHNRRVLASLTPAEQVILADAQIPRSYVHNVIDAIGLWKWAKGRDT